MSRVSVGFGRLLLLLTGGIASGCELAEVTSADPQEVVIAEVYLRVNAEDSDAIAIVHRTIGSSSNAVPGAAVFVGRPGGPRQRFQDRLYTNCVDLNLPEGFVPSCFLLFADQANGLIEPGARLEVTVELPNGGRITGITTVPGDFQIRIPPNPPGTCTMREKTLLPVRWTRSAGAWAYLPESLVFGLQEILGLQGIEVKSNPVTLQGLALSEADTTIVLPAEFGIFNRFSEDRETILAIRDGFPAGVTAEIIVTALDRNMVNWMRGGVFNPSGQIRIPSLFGDGTGVVGSVVNRSQTIFVADADFPTPDC